MSGSSSFTLEKGATVTVTPTDFAPFSITANEDADTTISYSDGKFSITADSDKPVSIIVGDGNIGKINLTGTFELDTQNNTIKITKDSEFELITNSNMTFTGIPNEDFTIDIAIDEITGALRFKIPNTSGSVTVAVKNGDETLAEGLEITPTGEFTLNSYGTISVSKDSALNIKIGDNTSISFSVTDDAGGKFGFTDKGISFTPNADDGKLEITVTDGENTRTTSLEVTGPINYTLGGIIQLSEGTVLKNEFEDGEVLTISANKDVSGIMYFTSDNGLVIVSDDEDLTLGINFPNNTVANFDSIKGAIVYKGGVVTLTDGTEMKEILSAPPAGDDSEDTPPESEMVSIVKSEGGSSTIDFSVSGKIIFTPGEGATLYTPHDFVISKGSFTLSHEEDLEGANGVLSVGTVATKNSPAADPFTLEKAGTYTLNGDTITTTEDGVEVKLADGNAVVFDVDAAVEVTGHEITGVEGTQVKISNGNKDISVLMSKAGTAKFDGQTFELTEDIDNANEIILNDDGFTVKGAVNEENVDAVRAVENVKISGTEDYTVKIGKYGVEEIGNVASGSNIQSNFTLYDKDDKEWLNEGGEIAIVTAEKGGTFNFGTNAYKITGDESANLMVDFDENGNGVVTEISDFENGVFEGKINNELTVNGDEITFSGVTDDFGFIVMEGHIYVGGIEEGGTVEFDSENVGVVFEGSEVTVNDVTYSIEGDSNGVTIEGNEISLLDKDARITVSKAGTYVVNGTPLDVKTNDIILGVSETEARIYTPIGTNATTENILDDLEVSTDNVEYVTEDSDEETSLSKAEEKAVVVEKDVESDKKVTLGDKGGVAIVEETSAEIDIVGGKGKDTLVSKGKDVTFDMSKGGQDKVMATAGSVSLKGYDTDTNAGIKLTEEQADEGIKFDSGRVVLGQDINKSPEVILGSESANFANIYTPEDEEKRVGFATEGNKVVDASDNKKGMILIGGGEIDGMSLAEEIEESTLKGGSGNDTILSGAGSYIDPGAGKNIITMSEDGGSTVNISSGKTSIDGFNFIDEDSDSTADKLQTGTVAIDNIKVSDGDVIIKAGSGRVQINDAEGKAIAFQNSYTNNTPITLTAAETELEVSGNGLYWATGKNATVKVDGNYEGDSAVFNLADANFNNGGVSFYGNIKALDATGYTGDAVLRGNNGNNVITAGEGNSTLWGGDGGNDTLIGGDGNDTFVFGKGNGKDVIEGATSDDLVVLSGVTLSDLVAIDKDLFSNGSDVKFTLQDGSTLTVKDAQTSGVAVDINGTKYRVNGDSGEWEYV